MACSMLDYLGRCFLAQIVCDRLYSASSGFYVNAEAPFCWLGLFIATVGMI
jgi:hypothetical protein